MVIDKPIGVDGEEANSYSEVNLKNVFKLYIILIAVFLGMLIAGVLVFTFMHINTDKIQSGVFIKDINVSGSIVEISIPPTVIFPLLTSQNLAASLDTVVFQPPDGPINAVTSPCFATNDTSFNTTSLVSYANPTLENSISYPLLFISVVPL